MIKSENMFNDKIIRSKYNDKNNELLFSAIDVCGVLSGSDNPRHYWSDLKRQLVSEKNELYEKIVQLKMPTPDGKMRKTDALNRDGIISLARRIKSLHREELIE